jgi:hypothetical protein
MLGNRRTIQCGKQWRIQRSASIKAEVSGFKEKYKTNMLCQQEKFHVNGRWKLRISGN